ncbi:hypothetical protein GCM10007425_09700 [Lysinibacillus alkalisoli]|uniref:Glycosyltransferase n=1 Tax=Lysinibacillus alkalisoli TaxID=1911548 RepID=A0A917G1C8_9BACI|nr:flagellar brake domain-containing protein [Lysinibacillus alkalisoli]GGG17369.1 hypothetical protein GCM10007425_09700 [Lysinibacillus alkalisoli]
MELKAGTEFYLEPTYTDRVERFRCKVGETTNEAIFIHYPINTLTQKTAFFVDGMQFRVTYMVDNNSSYAFQTEVIGRKVVDQIPMLMLTMPKDEDVQKIQRREYVRVETAVDVAISIDGQHYQYVTEDVSAGGVALKLRNDTVLKETMEVLVTMVLPFTDGTISYVTTEATVMRIFEREPMRIASLQFTDTDELDKQHIVRFCFERQLADRKKQTEI